MNSSNKSDTPRTAVQTTQELLSLQSARLQKQGKEHELDKNPMIKALQDELSLYGDSVAASVNRTDPYYEQKTNNDSSFREAVQRVQQGSGEIPESLQKIIARLMSE